MISERIAIRKGRVVDPANRMDGACDVFLADGKILSIGSRPEGFTADREFAVPEQIVAPGLIDLCVRMREPGQEHKATIASECEAAVAAGVTTACCPPDTDPVVDTPAVVNLLRKKAADIGKVRLLPIGALTKGLNGQDLSEMTALRAAGCLAVSNAWAPAVNTQILRRAFEYAAGNGLCVFVRPEDVWLSKEGCVHEGETGMRLGLPGIPVAAETVAVAQTLALIEETGARIHFGQISSARAANMIAQASLRGMAVTADVAVHQLHLTETDVEGFNALCHVRPPFRTAADRQRLRELLATGAVTAVCSDHQPHEANAKLNVFPSTAPGVASLETLVPLMLRLVDEGVMDLSTAIARMTVGPARILNIDAGTLTPGAVADVCIVDPGAEWVVHDETWRSAGKNTPYWGTRLKGRVTHTFREGRLVYQA